MRPCGVRAALLMQHADRDRPPRVPVLSRPLNNRSPAHTKHGHQHGLQAHVPLGRAGAAGARPCGPRTHVSGCGVGARVGAGVEAGCDERGPGAASLSTPSSPLPAKVPAGQIRGRERCAADPMVLPWWRRRPVPAARRCRPPCLPDLAHSLPNAAATSRPTWCPLAAASRPSRVLRPLWTS